jgi:hypothetical protein
MLVKKWWIILCCAVLFTGCASSDTFENVDDELLQPVMAQVGQINLVLPPEASSQTMLGSDTDKLYFCDGYTAMVQIMDRGDLDKTCRRLCGFGADGVNILETAAGTGKRYDWVWTAAGEGGDVLGRAAVIDDGKYHYCVSLLADDDTAGELEGSWSKLLNSFYVS